MALSTLLKGLATGATFGGRAVGAGVAAGVGLGLGPIAGAAILKQTSKLDFRGQGRASGFAGPKPDPLSKAKKESGAEKKVSANDDVQSAILQIDKTLLAAYRVGLANNKGILRIQQMLKGQGEARAKELRMESGGKASPIIINNIQQGGGKKETPWWLPFLLGTLLAAIDDDPVGGKSKTRPRTGGKTAASRALKEVKGLREFVERRFKGLDKRLSRVEVTFDKKLGEVRTNLEQKIADVKAAAEKGNKLVTDKVVTENKLVTDKVVTENKLVTDKVVTEAEITRDRFNRALGERVTDTNRALIEERGRPRSLIERLGRDIKVAFENRFSLFEKSFWQSRAGSGPRYRGTNISRNFVRNWGTNIVDEIRGLRDSLYRTRGPRGGVVLGDQIRLLETSVATEIKDAKTQRATILEGVDKVRGEVAGLTEAITGEKADVKISSPKRVRTRLPITSQLAGIANNVIQFTDARMALQSRNINQSLRGTTSQIRAGQNLIIQEVKLVASGGTKTTTPRVVTTYGQGYPGDRGGARPVTPVTSIVNKLPVSTAGQVPPIDRGGPRLGVDGKPVSAGAVPFTEAELARLNAADAERMNRLANTRPSSTNKVIDFEKYRTEGRGGSGSQPMADHTTSDAKLKAATAKVKNSVKPLKVKWIFGKTITFNPRGMLTYIANAARKGADHTRVPRGLNKFIMLGFLGWILGCFIWNFIRLVMGGYGPVGSSEANAAYMLDQKMLFGMVVAAGLTWVVVEWIINIIVGLIGTALPRAMSFIAPPFGWILGLAVNFIVTGFLVHKFQRQIESLMFKAGILNESDMIKLEEVREMEAQQKKLKDDYQRKVVAPTILASGLQNPNLNIRAGDFSMKSWNMGTRRGDQTDFLRKHSTRYGGMNQIRRDAVNSKKGANAAGSSSTSSTSSLSAEAGYNALGKVIMSGESAQKGYSDYVKGSKFKKTAIRGSAGTLGKFGITKMTIGSILVKQGAGELGAVGKYQIIQDTLRMAVDNGVVTTMDKFSQTTQDKIYKWIIHKKRPEIGQYLSTGEGLLEAQIAMAKEWASIGMPIDYDVRSESTGKIIRSIKKGESYYKGVGNNKAHILPSDIMVALIQLREALLAQGIALASISGGGNGSGTIVKSDTSIVKEGDTSMVATNIMLDPYAAFESQTNALYAYG